MVRWVFQNGDWARLELRRPATTHLSPYVEWISILDDIKRRGDLEDELQDQLADEYQTLAASEDAGMADYAGYLDQLGDYEMLAKPDLSLIHI